MNGFILSNSNRRPLPGSFIYAVERLQIDDEGSESNREIVLNQSGRTILHEEFRKSIPGPGANNVRLRRGNQAACLYDSGPAPKTTKTFPLLQIMKTFAKSHPLWHNAYVEDSTELHYEDRGPLSTGMGLARNAHERQL